MQNTAYAPCDDVMATLHVALGSNVESKELFIGIRAMVKRPT